MRSQRARRKKTAVTKEASKDGGKGESLTRFQERLAGTAQPAAVNSLNHHRRALKRPGKPVTYYSRQRRE